MSAEILIAIPDGVGSKTHKLLLGLADTKSSTSLANEIILGSRPRKKKEKATVYNTQVWQFKTTKEC